ncbi:MAG: ATP-binding protein [Candidatus Poribacteria bacterium]|nr:ATP-binding protein [Candidatus Poribacteria bacterium]
MIQRIWPQILEAYEKERSHIFLVHYNVNDLTANGAYGYMPLSDALLWNIAQMGGANQPWLVFEFDPINGARFPERMQLRGNGRSNWQMYHGLNASLYKYAQGMAVNRNHKAAIRSLRLLVQVPGFVDLIKSDTGGRKAFASLKGNDEFEALLNTKPSILHKQINDGLETKETGIGGNIEPGELLKRLWELIKENPHGRRVGGVISRAEMLLPLRPRSSKDLFSDALISWASSDHVRRKRNMLILMTEDIEMIDISFRNARSVCHVQAPLPNANELRHFIRHLSVMPRHWKPLPPPKDDKEKNSPEYQKMAREWPDQYDSTQIPDAMQFEGGMDRQTAAERCAGLRIIDVHDTHLKLAMTSEPISQEELDDARLMWTGFHTQDVFELTLGDMPDDHAAGLEHAERYFASIAARLYEGDPGMPAGAWLAGAQGSGKYTAVRRLATEHGLPVFRVRRPAELIDRYVSGDQEIIGTYPSALRHALRYAYSVAPAILELDSVERWLRSSNAQSLAAILETVRDQVSRGRLFLIARVSNPSLISFSRLTMSDMDALAFFPPAAKHRAAVMLGVMRQQGLSYDEKIPFEEIARRPEANGLTGGDIAAIVSRAGERAREKERGRVSALISSNELQKAIERANMLRRNPIEKEDLEHELVDYSPGLPPNDAHLITLQAALMATARSHLPDDIDPPLAQIVLDNGRVAKQRIQEHIRRLSQQRRRPPTS